MSVVVGAALACSTIGVAGAADPITGDVNCIVKGTATLKKGLPLLSPGPVSKPVKTKIGFKGTLEGCTGTQVGTKNGLQIEAGTISAKGTAIVNPPDDGPSCLGLADPPATPTQLKASIKFTNDDSGKPKTIAKSSGVLLLGAANTGPPTSFETAGQVTKGAFLSETVTVTAVLDLDQGQLAAACTAPGGLTTLQFTGVHGDSVLDIP
jgi:hypothetical protein